MMSDDFNSKLKKLLNTRFRSKDKDSGFTPKKNQKTPRTAGIKEQDSSPPIESPAPAAKEPISVTKPKTKKPLAPGTDPKKAIIDATIGIDFGTRFTKVAVYFHQPNRYFILTLKPNEKFLPSRVCVDHQGKLYAPDKPYRDKFRKKIEYLKMHLARPKGAFFGGGQLVSGRPLESVINPISSLFLSGVLRLAKAAAMKEIAKTVGKDREIRWTANIGVPVQYCDGKEIDVFREVANVAWFWQENKPDAFYIEDLLQSYSRTVAKLPEQSDIPIDVAPELTAALAHFVDRRTTAEGMYAFFDIGGGTLDGTAFLLSRLKGTSRVDILAAYVDDIGTMAVARRALGKVYEKIDTLVEPLIISGGQRLMLEMPVDEIEEKVQSLFCKVVIEAKQKNHGAEFNELDSGRPKLKSYTRGHLPSYPVFLAGGGARSEWYKSLFEGCHKARSLHQWDIGECVVKIIPPPPGVNADDYPRFVIAIGLTSENLHFKEFHLPKEASVRPALPERKPKLLAAVSKDDV